MVEKFHFNVGFVNFGHCQYFQDHRNYRNNLSGAGEIREIQKKNHYTIVIVSHNTSTTLKPLLFQGSNDFFSSIIEDVSLNYDCYKPITIEDFLPERLNKLMLRYVRS